MHVNDADTHAPRLRARVENDFDFLSDEYRALFAGSAATVFQGPLWLHCLYSTLAPQLGAKPHIIAVRDAANGRLRMVLPLVLQRSLEVGILQPADLGVADYNAPVARPVDLVAFGTDKHLVRQVQRLLSIGDVLIFRKVQGLPADIAGLVGAGRQRRNENAGYEISLASPCFDSWQRDKLKKKFRNGTAKRLRTLQERHADVRFVEFQTCKEIEAAIRFMAAHRTARFRDDILNDPAYVDFYLRYAREGGPTGEAITTGLIVDGRLVSANFGIVGNGAYHALLSGSLIEEFGDYAPGLQSMLDVLRRRHAAGDIRFDFGIGGSRYKKDLSATEIPLYNLTVPRTVSGQVVSLVYNQAKPLKTALRRLVGSIR